MGINVVADLIHPVTGETHSEGWLRRRIQRCAKVSGDHVVSTAGRDIMGFRQRNYLPISTLLKQWKRIVEAVGEYTIRTAA